MNTTPAQQRIVQPWHHSVRMLGLVAHKATMKSKPLAETLEVKGADIERVIKELNDERRRIVSADVRGEECYLLTLAPLRPNRNKLRHTPPPFQESP